MELRVAVVEEYAVSVAHYGVLHVVVRPICDN